MKYPIIMYERFNLYEIQKDFINRAQEVIDKDGIGIFSSPTGTGKTRSLLLSLRKYIRDGEFDNDIGDRITNNNSTYESKNVNIRNECEKDEHKENKKVISDVKIKNITIEDSIGNNSVLNNNLIPLESNKTNKNCCIENKKYNDYPKNLSTEKIKTDKSQFFSISKLTKTFYNSFNDISKESKSKNSLSNEKNSNLGLSLENKALLSDIFEDTKSKPTIFYCSRTHSQLIQAINELKVVCPKAKSLIVGSRKVYCINDGVICGDNVEYLNLDSINEKCSTLVDNNSCEFYRNYSVLEDDGSIDFKNSRIKSIDAKSDDEMINYKNSKEENFNYSQNNSFKLDNSISNERRAYGLKSCCKSNSVYSIETENNFKNNSNNKKDNYKFDLDVSTNYKKSDNFSINEDKSYNTSNQKFSNTVMDIEDVLKYCKPNKICSYFYTKSLSQHCDILFMPYTLLFSSSGRKSFNIEIKDSIIVVDEAHNIYETVIQMNSVILHKNILFMFHDFIIKYFKLYGSRMSEENLKMGRILIKVLECIRQFLDSDNNQKNSQKFLKENEEINLLNSINIKNQKINENLGIKNKFDINKNTLNRDNFLKKSNFNTNFEIKSLNEKLGITTKKIESNEKINVISKKYTISEKNKIKNEKINNEIKVKVMKVSEFLIKTSLYDYNMIEIDDFIEEYKLVQKVTGMTKENVNFFSVSKFLKQLTVSDESGRIFYSDNSIKFTPLNPKIYFEEILKCKALILAGGTMEPIDNLVDILQREGDGKDFLNFISSYNKENNTKEININDILVNENLSSKNEQNKNLYDHNNIKIYKNLFDSKNNTSNNKHFAAKNSPYKSLYSSNKNKSNLELHRSEMTKNLIKNDKLNTKEVDKNFQKLNDGKIGLCRNQDNLNNNRTSNINQIKETEIDSINANGKKNDLVDKIDKKRKIESNDLKYKLEKILKSKSLSDISQKNIKTESTKCISGFIPANEIKNSTKMIFNNGNLEYFSYKHVCEKYKAFIMAEGPSKKELKLCYENKENETTINEYIKSIFNLTNTVKKGGIICFIPSKSYILIFKKALKTNSNYSKFSETVFFDGDIDFETFKKKLNVEKKLILFSVMGGKLSEGINFSDDLCRLLIVLGIPYPTINLELDEREKYYHENKKLNNENVKIQGSNYSTLIAMKTVNQTLGRALRHKNDYGCIVLMDKRYRNLINYLSSWVKEKLNVKDFKQIMMELIEFYKKA